MHQHLPFADSQQAAARMDALLRGPKKEEDVCLWISKAIGWVVAGTIGLFVFFSVPLFLPFLFVYTEWVNKAAESSFLRLLPNYARTTGAVLGVIVIPLALFHLKRLMYADSPVKKPLMNHHQLLTELTAHQSNGSRTNSNDAFEFGGAIHVCFSLFVACLKYIFDLWPWRLLGLVMRIIFLGVLCIWPRSIVSDDSQVAMVPWHAPNVLARAGLYHGYQSFIGHRYTHSRLEMLPDSELSLRRLATQLSLVNSRSTSLPTSVMALQPRMRSPHCLRSPPWACYAAETL